MSETTAKINWYPGHMTKAVRSMKEDLKLIDLVIELIDARVPLSSRNPDLDGLCRGKARFLLMTKADLADPQANDRWRAYYEAKGLAVVVTDARNGRDKSAIEAQIRTALQKKSERDRARGIMNRPLRVMIAGIPNVGKSTLINSLAGKTAAKTGDKPGVTKGNQWINIGRGVELLDTPGILWPRFEDPMVGVKLALIGSINDNILDAEELACEGIKYLVSNYPGVINARYGACEEGMSYEVLTDIARHRNLVKSGAAPDTLRAARLFLDDLRSSRTGRFTLEVPEEIRA
ncbi:MAG: ribosome biogenesis GTPase YlqF [Lachnospiraceae bacterium]|nr:ribosome biogenesis GTPase YlqF [Lachnospiraceae bacterium]